jgi:predicted RNA binding protein YcfA (HicA-like mRNA interferase family)
MKIPRDCHAAELTRALKKFGYEFDRQSGSHITLTTRRNGEHHVTVPNHRPIKMGTLQGLLKSVAAHHKMAVPDLLRELGL